MIATSYALALAAVVGFGGGWLVNGYRLDAEIADLKADHASVVAAETGKTLRAQKDLQAEKDGRQAQIDAVELTAQQTLGAANAETIRLRTCIANGTCGLRVNTIRAACASDVPGTGPAVSVDVDTGTRLTADAEQAYFTLRDAIPRIQSKLAACQASYAVGNPQAQ